MTFLKTIIASTIMLTISTAARSDSIHEFFQNACAKNPELSSLSVRTVDNICKCVSDTVLEGITAADLLGTNTKTEKIGDLIKGAQSVCYAKFTEPTLKQVFSKFGTTIMNFLKSDAPQPTHGDMDDVDKQVADGKKRRMEKLAKAGQPTQEIPPVQGLEDSKSGTSSVSNSAASATTPSTFRISLVRKGFKNSDLMKSDFEDDITFTLKVENIGKKDVRAFDGQLIFTDLLDNEIHSVLLAINERVDAGAILVWNGELKYNQFIDSHQRLRSASFDNLKIKFATRKLLFADGSLLQLSQ